MPANQLTIPEIQDTLDEILTLLNNDRTPRALIELGKLAVNLSYHFEAHPDDDCDVDALGDCREDFANEPMGHIAHGITRVTDAIGEDKLHLCTVRLAQLSACIAHYLLDHPEENPPIKANIAAVDPGDDEDTDLAVGTTVVANTGHTLRDKSESTEYPYAIVASRDPFILVSTCGTSRWDHQSPQNFTHAGHATTTDLLTILPRLAKDGQP